MVAPVIGDRRAMRVENQRWWVGFAGLLSSVAAVLEMAALVLVALIAASIAGEDTALLVDVGPVRAELARSSGLWTALALALGAALVRGAVVVVQTRLLVATELMWRHRIIDAFLDADHLAQRSLPAGALVDHLGRASMATGTEIMARTARAQALLSASLFVVTALVVDLRISLELLAIGVVLLGVMRPLTRGIRSSSRRVADRIHRQSISVTETVRVARDIRLFEAGDRARDRLADDGRSVLSARRRTRTLVGLSPVVYQGTGMLVIIAMLAVVSSQAGSDIGSLAASALLLLRCVAFGQQAQNATNQLADAGSQVDHLHAALTDLERAEAQRGSVDVVTVERLSLERVSFGYDEAPALAGIDLEMRVGETVGVVGPSGSGKSTLSMLLLGLLSPSEGRVAVDGVDLRRVDPSSWHRLCALVPQRVELIEATVHDNIAYFRDGVTRRAVVRAAIAAGLHEAVEALPDGYDTVVGPHRRDLSGGQVQRIGIARALVTDPPVLILDEPTSALDVATERMIGETIGRLAGSRLIVLIAHRMATIGHCDRVLIFENGRVVADGPVAGADLAPGVLVRAAAG
ncbi:MAG: ATP-binding cassette domain-containing protein [Acidimicrobiales bacterium]